MPQVLKIKRRRHRTLSVEAEIKQRAVQIQRDQMSEAMLAAALMVVAKKQDEIIQLLSAYRRNAPVVLPRSDDGARQPVRVAESAAPCSYCGRESVKKIKPDGRWIKKEMYLCLGHLPMARQHERKMTEPVAEPAPIVAPDKPDTGGDVGIADAFAAVGIQTNAN